MDFPIVRSLSNFDRLRLIDTSHDMSNPQSNPKKNSFKLLTIIHVTGVVRLVDDPRGSMESATFLSRLQSWVSPPENFGPWCKFLLFSFMEELNRNNLWLYYLQATG